MERDQEHYHRNVRGKSSSSSAAAAAAATTLAGKLQSVAVAGPCGSSLLAPTAAVGTTTGPSSRTVPALPTLPALPASLKAAGPLFGNISMPSFGGLGGGDLWGC